MSQSESDSYTFPNALDPSVPQFFSKYKVNEWTFNSYENFCLSENPNITRNSIIKLYQDSLNKIISNKNVPDNIKGKAGVLVKNAVKNAKRKRKSRNEYEINIETNNGTVFGDVTINNGDSSIISRKQKVDHINDGSTSWNINNQEDIWDAWRQYLDACNYHDFCLEKYHTIECGYSIKCNPFIPQELYHHVDASNYTVTSPFQACTEYTNGVLAVMKTNDLEAAEKVVVYSKESVEKALDALSLNFTKEFFKLCLRIYRKPNLYERLTINETSFNHALIWPIMELAVDIVKKYALKFVPAEYSLLSSKEDYKADACVL